MMEPARLPTRLHDARIRPGHQPTRATMIKTTGLALASAMLFTGFGATGAAAFMPKPVGLDAATAIVTPAAMCGRSCRNGGRYIPGPPSVCAGEGLNYRSR